MSKNIRPSTNHPRNRSMRATALLRHAIPAILLLGGLISTSVFAFEQPKIYDLKPNDRVIILGDSTTPTELVLGGYVFLVNQVQKEQAPEKKAVVYGFGWPQHGAGSLLGDNGQINLYVRTKTKTEPPTVAIINMGLNDSKGGNAAIPAYVETLRKAVQELRDLKVTPILCAITTWGGLDQTKAYAEAARVLASELKCPLIDLYAAHAEQISISANGKGGAPTYDGVHLSLIGETLSAKTILQAFGLKPVWREKYLRLTTMRESWSTGEWGNFTVVESNRSDNLPAESKGNHPWGGVTTGYPAGTKVTVTMTPRVGFEIIQWIDMDYRGSPASSQPDLGKSATIALTLDQNRFLLCMVRPKKDQVSKP